jgi:hypothetical protein
LISTTQIKLSNPLVKWQIATQAGMAELADALDLGSSAVKGVQVQVLFPAPEFFQIWSNS